MFVFVSVSLFDEMYLSHAAALRFTLILTGGLFVPSGLGKQLYRLLMAACCFQRSMMWKLPNELPKIMMTGKNQSN